MIFLSAGLLGEDEGEGARRRGRKAVMVWVTPMTFVLNWQIIYGMLVGVHLVRGEVVNANTHKSEHVGLDRFVIRAAENDQSENKTRVRRRLRDESLQLDLLLFESRIVALVIKESAVIEQHVDASARQLAYFLRGFLRASQV